MFGMFTQDCIEALSSCRATQAYWGNLPMLSRSVSNIVPSPCTNSLISIPSRNGTVYRLGTYKAHHRQKIAVKTRTHVRIIKPSQVFSVFVWLVTDKTTYISFSSRQGKILQPVDNFGSIHWILLFTLLFHFLSVSRIQNGAGRQKSGAVWGLVS